MNRAKIQIKGLDMNWNDRFVQTVYSSPYAYNLPDNLPLHLDWIDTMPDDLRTYKRISVIKITNYDC